jgi:hypothetical protein
MHGLIASPKFLPGIIAAPGDDHYEGSESQRLLDFVINELSGFRGHRKPIRSAGPHVDPSQQVLTNL